jgi:hypothetical protein
MRKTLVLLLLLLSACCLLAQDNMGKAADSENTIQGCLSNASGHYYLTDSAGTRYFLSGYANRLKGHIGHEVAITGVDSVKTTSTTQQGAASTAHQQHVFRVQSIKHIADTCAKQ